MALMYCRECGEKVSSEARTCPHCGIDWPVLTDEIVARRRAEETRASAHEMAARKHPFNPGVAALLSLIIPGAGQMYRGKVGPGLVWLFFVVLGYMMFIVPGLILHLFCIVAAASGE